MRRTGSRFVALVALLSYNTKDSFAQAKLSWLPFRHHGGSSAEILDSSSSYKTDAAGEAVGPSSRSDTDEGLGTSSTHENDPIGILEEDLDVIMVLAEEGSSCTDGCTSVGLNCSEASLATGGETVFGTRSAFEDVLATFGVSCKRIGSGGYHKTTPYVQIPSGTCHLDNRGSGDRLRGSFGRCDASHPHQRRLCSCFDPAPVEPSEPCTPVMLADITTNFGEGDGLELQSNHRGHLNMTADECSEKLGTSQGDGTINYVTYSGAGGWCRTYLDFHASSKALHSDTSVTQAWACSRSNADDDALSTILDRSCINSGIQPGGPFCFNRIEDIQDVMNNLNGSDAVIALCRSSPHPTFALNSSLSVPNGTNVRLCYAGMEGYAALAPSGLNIGMPLVEAVASPASFTLDRLLLSGGSPNVLIDANARATIRSSILEYGQGKFSNRLGGNLVAVDPSKSKLGKLVLEDTIIRNGVSPTTGAGVYIQDFGSAEVSRCSIDGNQVFNSQDARGAGLAAKSVDLVLIMDSSISNNRAEATGIDGYAAGGGIYIEESEENNEHVIIVTSSTFENNTIMGANDATGAAGLLVSFASQVYLRGNIGEGNIAKVAVDDDCDVEHACICDGFYVPNTKNRRELDLVRPSEGCGDGPNGPYNRSRRVPVCAGCSDVSADLSFKVRN